MAEPQRRRVWLDLDPECVAHLDHALSSYVSNRGAGMLPSGFVALAENVHETFLLDNSRQRRTTADTSVAEQESIGHGAYMPSMLTLREVADRWGCSERTVRRRASGPLPLRIVGIGGMRRVRLEDLLAYETQVRA